MVRVRVTYGEQDQISRTYEAAGGTYKKVQRSLANAGVPAGIFYFLNPRRIVTALDLDDEVEDQELYYGIDNPFLHHTSQLFDNIGNSDRVREHLAASADPNLPNSDGWTPLNWAARRGSLEVISALLNAGADPNLPNKYGSIPLHLAAYQGSLEVVQALLNAGANVNLPNKHGDTPLHWAVDGGSLEVVQVLLNAGANVNLPNKYGSTPLHQATERESLEVVQVLLNAGANVNLPDKYGSTPLHQATEKESLEVVQVLLAAGALDTPNNAGRTAQEIARYKGRVDIADAIRDYQPFDIKEPAML